MKEEKERQRKAIYLLKTFKKNQINKLDKYLKNEYFLANEMCISLFELLKIHHPRFSKISNQVIREHLFPNESEQDFENEINDIFSNLHKKILDFIALEKFLKDKKQRDDYTNEYYRQQHFYHLFEKSISKKWKDLEKQPLRDADYFYQKMKIHDHIYFHVASNKFKKKISTDEKSELIQSAENSEINFMLTRLRQSLELLQRARIISEPIPKIAFLDEILSLSEENSFYKNPILEIYVELVRLAKGKKSSKNFDDLINLFSKNTHLILPAERREILQFFLNEVGYSNRSSKKEIAGKKLELYKIGAEKNCFVVHDQISAIVFSNVVVTFSQDDEFNFVKKFIQKYSPFLQSNLKLEVVRFANACLFFYKKEYSAAAALFAKKKKFTQLYLEHRAKIMFLCCKYELYLQDQLPLEKGKEAFDMMNDAIHAFERYYQRKTELTKNKTQPYLNFAKTLRQIFEAKDISKNNRNQQKKNLLATIETYSAVAAKSWLLNHIQKL